MSFVLHDLGHYVRHGTCRPASDASSGAPQTSASRPVTTTAETGWAGGDYVLVRSLWHNSWVTIVRRSV